MKIREEIQHMQNPTREICFRNEKKKKKVLQLLVHILYMNFDVIYNHFSS